MNLLLLSTFSCLLCVVFGVPEVLPPPYSVDPDCNLPCCLEECKAKNTVLYFQRFCENGNFFAYCYENEYLEVVKFVYGLPPDVACTPSNALAPATTSCPENEPAAENQAKAFCNYRNRCDGTTNFLLFMGAQMVPCPDNTHVYFEYRCRPTETFCNIFCPCYINGVTAGMTVTQQNHKAAFCRNLARNL